MNKIEYFLVMFIGFALSVGAANDNYRELNFGINTESLITSSFVESKLALSLWMQEVADTEKTKLNVVFYDNHHSLISDFSNNKIQVLVTDTLEFLENKNNLNLSDSYMWSLSGFQDSKFYRYFLISNKNSNIYSLKQIKNKKIAFKENDQLGKVWLNSLLYKNHLDDYKQLISEENNLKKRSQLVLEVFFNNVDLAVVSEDTWSAMIRINPNLEKKINILATSERLFLPIIGLVSKKNNSNNIMKRFINISNKAVLSVRERKIRELIKLAQTFEITLSDIETLDSFYLNYKKMKVKNSD